MTQHGASAQQCAIVQRSWLERPAATVAFLIVVMVSAVALSVLVWRLIEGPAPVAVPVTATIVSPIVALPLLLFLQNVIRRLAQSQRTLTQLTAQLAEATEAAERASGAKSEFLARMSHELRTPLNAVIGYSELLLEDAEAGGMDPEHAADLRRIKSAGQNLLSLVNDVIDLSEIEAGRMKSLTQPIELGAFVDDIVATARPLLAARESELRVERGGDLGTITGDVPKLRQVALSLLGHTAKLTQSGCVTLSVARERHSAGDWISIAVSDSGACINRQTLARLFASVTPGDPAMAAKFGAAGLGLALSRKLCRLMGGELAAESEPGRGSRFLVRVPAGQESSVVSGQSAHRPVATDD
jgi:signal transduction histidine kinase